MGSTYVCVGGFLSSFSRLFLFLVLLPLLLLLLLLLLVSFELAAFFPGVVIRVAAVLLAPGALLETVRVGGGCLLFIRSLVGRGGGIVIRSPTGLCPLGS